MMIGGDERVVDALKPIFETLAPAKDAGWGRVGPVGAGHFTKMVHNGIEYGLMQAYAEGFSILEHKQEFALDLHQIGEIWRQGSVVRSWLLDLLTDAVGKNPTMEGIAPYVADSGEGRWTLAEAIDLDVPAPVIALVADRTLALTRHRLVHRQTARRDAQRIRRTSDQEGMSDPSIRAQAGGTRWHPFATSAALIADARDRVVAAANDAIASRGRFIVVLAGGDTPRALYRSLRDADTDWTRWHIYYGDERCVDADDAERNSVMAAETLLDAVAIPREQCHAIAGELGAEAAARAYAATLRDVGTFDLVLLGLGEDGHTASLFPHANEHRVDVARRRDCGYGCAEAAAGARFAERSATVGCASSAVSRRGESKRDAVRRWREGEAMPAVAIRPAAGVDVLVDAGLMG